jgi:hypothetical protein
VAAHVGVIGKRLLIAFRSASMRNTAQLVKRRLRDAEIDRRIYEPQNQFK